MPYPKPIPVLIEELGGRIEAFRLSRNQRQVDVAAEAGISRATLVRLEKGRGASLETLVRVLAALDLGERLADLVPDPRVSPFDPRADAKDRKRARPREGQEDETPSTWRWGEK